ncbi:NAD(P)H-dependent glycerol-3-phosphate dehydrogenase [Bosea sp. (in: a-proteobacteria)]|uniref:NAD(P)H-dependent glycerol-3-phosphate dehydrogenase n=1 Tax=Bosea sp. (in: a-proteobacteria) TaxID=1871050 RepID=UPI0012051A45|nr:NAD(P)H-dependent glycerol-3-phosphate dehydrogenase [Bosea sp. (in: a-proteobacteria)]TAJ28889.1 MAG: NAD(P)-dependent glycerol-3-phosphate dehydrogenase [Bosea sp. (in: a-proteobacteria)]
MTTGPAFAEIGIVGGGAYGAALALAAARAGRGVRLWARDGATVAAIQRNREAPRLPGIALPEAIRATDNLSDLAACDALIVAVPTQHLREACVAMAAVLPRGAPVVSAAKGIERATGLFATDIIARTWTGVATAILSGPSFAEDIGRGLPTAVTLAAADAALARGLAESLNSSAFRIYHASDVRGVEIGGAAKNVLAIAAGIAIGLGFGESARAALVARGFAELRRFGEAHGAEPETLMGLSGLGDVVLSCASPQSRNFAYGLALGQGRTPAEASGGRLAEGAFTAPILAEMARAEGVDMPIAAAVAAIIAGQTGVRDAVAALLARPIRAEI